MAYNNNVTKNSSQVEYSKFVEIENDSRFPAISVTRVLYGDSSQAFGGQTNTPLLTSVDIYPKYAVLSYIANTDDFSVTLSAEQVNLSTQQIEAYLQNINVTTTDHTTFLQAIEQNTFDTASATDQMFQELIDISTKASELTSRDFSTSEKQDIQITLVKTLTTNSEYGTRNELPLFTTSTISNPTLKVTQEPTQVDAFGRLRVSNPFTLFDSSHRYKDNNLWSSLTAAGGSHSFNSNQGLIEMTVNGLSGSSVIRETTKVFSYQPGKSLLVMNTFVMASSTNDLRQRVGYFGNENGIYFQLDDGNISFVKRSIVGGSVSDIVVSQSNWNGDKLDGTGSSGFVLDVTKAQIFWMDIEWLGVGTVRTGFIINGQFITCHSFHHANIIDSTYITTASLPIRYEITNKAATGTTKTLKQICSTVISEGGYELRGLQQAVGTPITSAKILTTAGIYYPVISLRLKSNRLDAIVVPTATSIIGSSDAIYNWQIRSNTTTTAGSWVDAGEDSAVEYNLTGTGITGGRILASGYFITNQFSKGQIDILREALFKFQLERNGLTGTPFEMSLSISSNGSNKDVFGSLDWEEVTR